MNSEELLAPIPSHISNSLEQFQRLSKLREQEKNKQHELQKALNEITLTQKDEKYQTYLLNTIKQMEEKNVEKRKTLEERRAKLLRDIEKIDREIEKLDNADENQSTSYFVNELARINDTKKSNPKIRALEYDLECIKNEVKTIVEGMGKVDDEINKRVEADNRKKQDLLASRQAEIERIQKAMEAQRKNPPKAPSEVWEERKNTSVAPASASYYPPPSQTHQPTYPNIISDTKTVKKRVPKSVSIE